MQVLCALYGFPDSYADATRGEQQYREISRAVEKNPEVSQLIRQLEYEYDRAQPREEPEGESGSEGISMPAEMEKFLRELENGTKESDD
jgi:flagellar biosynthesis chaperone FliJ